MNHEKCVVCGIDVGDSKIALIDQGKELHFCCIGCKQQFEAKQKSKAAV